MTIAELGALLNGISGFSKKVTYYAWKEGSAPALPFICFFTPSSKSFSADGIVYYQTNEFKVELYSAEKDETSEGKIEQAFTNNNIYWTKGTDYIAEEKCYITVYEIEV